MPKEKAATNPAMKPRPARAAQRSVVSLLTCTPAPIVITFAATLQGERPGLFRRPLGGDGYPPRHAAHARCEADRYVADPCRELRPSASRGRQVVPQAQPTVTPARAAGGS